MTSLQKDEKPVNQWNPLAVKHLRYRMGWSQAELARNLSCDLELIFAIERGETIPDPSICKVLLGLQSQAQNQSEKIQKRARAEVMMREMGLAQIHDDQISIELTIEEGSTDLTKN